jgi:hypothetical protein
MGRLGVGIIDVVRRRLDVKCADDRASLLDRGVRNGIHRRRWIVGNGKPHQADRNERHEERRAHGI